jgi:hypothetical protein
MVHGYPGMLDFSVTKPWSPLYTWSESFHWRARQLVGDAYRFAGAVEHSERWRHFLDVSDLDGEYGDGQQTVEQDLVGALLLCGESGVGDADAATALYTAAMIGLAI